ncbi:9003_t:CDS:2, partial [Cetraspora pellucida]
KIGEANGNEAMREKGKEIENKNQVQKKLGERQKDNSTIINNPTFIESAKEAVVPTFHASGDEETKALAQSMEKIGEANGNEAMREKGKEIENNLDEKQENDSTMSNNPILIETKEAVSIGGDRALAPNNSKEAMRETRDVEGNWQNRRFAINSTENLASASGLKQINVAEIFSKKLSVLHN